MEMIIECWRKGRLVAKHKCSDDLTPSEILERFGLNETWTVFVHPNGRPDLIRKVQSETP